MDGDFFWDMVAREVEKQNTTFEWLYLKTKVAKGTFSSWKTRKILPRADVAYMIAEALGVSVEYLLTGMDRGDIASNPESRTLLQSLAESLAFFDPCDRETLKALAASLSRRYRPGGA